MGRYNEVRKISYCKLCLLQRKTEDFVNRQKVYSVDQDYSPETREIRKKLGEYVKAKKAESRNRVRFSFDKPFVNGKAFTRNKKAKQVVPV